MIMAEPTRKKGKAASIDKHIGSQIRIRRAFLGISQERLGEAIGVTFQQIQKYESGANRVSVARLHEISKVLECSLDYFVYGDGLPVPNQESDLEESATKIDEQKEEFEKLWKRTLKIKDPNNRMAAIKTATHVIDGYIKAEKKNV